MVVVLTPSRADKIKKIPVHDKALFVSGSQGPPDECRSRNLTIA